MKSVRIQEQDRVNDSAFWQKIERGRRNFDRTLKAARARMITWNSPVKSHIQPIQLCDSQVSYNISDRACKCAKKGCIWAAMEDETQLERFTNTGCLMVSAPTLIAYIFGIC